MKEFNGICGIYKITSPSGKTYIGQSIDVDERFKYYRKLKCKKQAALYNSLVKYGADNHRMEVLFSIENHNQRLLDKMESAYIQYFDSLAPNGLNLRTGGRHYVFTDESRQKMCDAKLGKPLSLKHKESMKAVHKNNCIEVDQYSKDGEYMASFSSIGEASEKTNTNRDGIRDVCRMKKYMHTSGGFIWKFKNVVS